MKYVPRQSRHGKTGLQKINFLIYCSKSVCACADKSQV